MTEQGVPQPPDQPWQPPAHWAEPTGRPVRPARRLPTALKLLLAGVLTLAIAIGATWAAGGFQPRNVLTEAQAGESVDLGPVTITLREAELAGNTVHVAASCELTLNTARSSLPYALQKASFAAVRVDGELAYSESTRLELGIEADLDRYTRTRATWSPGLGPSPCLFTFGIPQGQYGDKIVVVLMRMEYVDRLNVQNEGADSRTWEAAIDGYSVVLPL